MTSRKNGLKKHLLKFWLAVTLIFFATTLVGTVQAADPLLTVIVSDYYGAIGKATVKIYDSSYTLVSQKETTANGTAKFSVEPYEYYYIVVSHSEYHDEYDMEYVSDYDEEVYIYLDRVRYYGSVKAAAWTGEPSLNPGDKSTLKISIYNENETYAITLVNVSIEFPWYGFYEDQWIGNETILEDMPVEIQNKSYWSYSLSFTAPSDSRAYGYGGQVVFNVKAPAWKTRVVMTTDGPEYKLEPELTTVKTEFATTPKISIGFPTTDRSVNFSLFLIQILLVVSIVCSAMLVALIFRLSSRISGPS